MMRIKKNDVVVVISGKDKGKSGSVIDILPKKGKVKVKGVAVATHFVKARRQGETSCIKKEEDFIDSSNVMPVCPKTKKPTRVNVMTENETKVRISNVSKEIL
jgi:large subunit ribosomal protein L24